MERFYSQGTPEGTLNLSDSKFKCLIVMIQFKRKERNYESKRSENPKNFNLLNIISWFILLNALDIISV